MSSTDDEVLLEDIRVAIHEKMSARTVSAREAGDALVRMRVPRSAVDKVVAVLEEEFARTRVLEQADGGRLAQEVAHAAWYGGPNDADRRWQALKAQMMQGSSPDVVDSVDRASTDVVKCLADPKIIGRKVQGLVLGHVQAGKTANFTAVAAKAADRGYKLVVVLAGIYNNLRDQTQARLLQDLGEDLWAFHTTPDADFSGTVSANSALSERGDKTVVIVIKKNAHRLGRLADWLAASGNLLRRIPTLIIDDEADQATPNSAKNRDEQTAINALVSKVWGLVKTGSYVGYTATPFANLLINPMDPRQLYPRDFIYALPRSDQYFGAERVFGQEAPTPDEQPSDGLDMVRLIPDADAAIVTPRAQDLDSYRPGVPQSLDQAIRWFVVASAARRARGQRAHSSMLIHTSARVKAHFGVAEAVNRHVQHLRTQGVDESFKGCFDAEIARVAGETTPPQWPDVAPHIVDVLTEVSTIVDNGSSDDRLNYRRTDENGTQVVQTVIAVGGGTLSRGLTLEGLVVSYFTRTSTTYDALLQMGRWFGYRNGYEDLVRVWATAEIEEHFQFLALVEHEIREEIGALTAENLSPSEIAVRIRQHVGRLSITSPGKMHHAKTVELSYNGQRLQTTIFDERNDSDLRGKIQAAQKLLQGRSASYQVGASTVFSGLHNSDIIGFLNDYGVHPNQKSIDVPLIAKWLDSAFPDSDWNVVVARSAKAGMASQELIPGVQIGRFTRAPLSSVTDVANIKALLSTSDWYADVPREELESLAGLAGGHEKRRSSSVQDKGMLLLMMLEKDGRPDAVQVDAGSRRQMAAAEHLLGFGLIFPWSKTAAKHGSGFVSVEVETVDVADDEPESFEDGE